MAKVLVEVVRNLTDQRAGDRAWVEENATVRGMVDGGYWTIVDRETETKRGGGAKNPAEPE